MPAALALILTILFIGFLFYRDYVQGYFPSIALCVPCIWMLILGSRTVTEWVHLGTRLDSASGTTGEGTLLDASVFAALMVCGLIILMKRSVPWGSIFRNNWALLLFVIYCGISVLWSDFPFVSFKRWVKAFGDPIMALIVLTDRNPLKATDVLFRVCTNTLLPISGLFVKYYPHLGRRYSEWTGMTIYTGVSTNKNLLGFVLMVCGLSLIWRLHRWNAGKTSTRLDGLIVPAVLFGITIWLFILANSKTSLLGFLLGLGVFVSLGVPAIRKRPGVFVMMGLLLVGVFELSFNAIEVLITNAGRNMTLTGRVELWDRVLAMQQNPFFGFGYESFWLGPRLTEFEDIWYFLPNQAHNGYIEMYLNLGWVGVLLFSFVVISTYTRLQGLLRPISMNEEWALWGRLGFAFLLVFLAYNYTEAAFKSPHFLFMIFVLFTIHRKVPSPRAGVSPQPEWSRVPGRFPVRGNPAG